MKVQRNVLGGHTQICIFIILLHWHQSINVIQVHKRYMGFRTAFKHWTPSIQAHKLDVYPRTTKPKMGEFIRYFFFSLSYSFSSRTNAVPMSRERKLVLPTTEQGFVLPRRIQWQGDK